MRRAHPSYARSGDPTRRGSGDGPESRSRHGVTARCLRPRANVVVALICGALLVGCNDSKNAYVPPPPPKVVVARPVQKSITSYLELTGNTAPFNSVTLVARVQGYVESIDYKDGAAVTK